MGNVLGYMGTGETLIAFDAHIDTVGIGNRNNWNFDPYEGYENERPRSAAVVYLTSAAVSYLLFTVLRS